MKKSLKKILSLGLISVMAFSLAACGGGSDDSSNAESSAESVSESESASESAESTSESSGETSSSGDGYVIGFSNYSVENTWRVQYEEEFKYHADELVEEGVIADYILTNAQGDSTKQISDVQDLITQGVDAILVSAGNPDALSPVCEEAVAQGIVVVSNDQLVTSDKMDAYISFPNYDYGKAQAEFVMEKLPDGGKIIILGGTAGSAGAEEQIEGAMDVLEGSNLEILTTEYCSWDYATAKQTMEDLITAYSEIDGIVSMGGAMTQACLDVLAAAGRPVDIPIPGEANNGYLKTWIEYMDEGYEGFAPVCQTSQGAMALDLAVEILNGNPPEEKNILIDVPTITEENVKEYVREDYSDSFWNYTTLPDEILDGLFKE